MNKLTLFPLVFAALLLAGCSWADKGSIKIISITPEPVTILHVGQKVDMEVVVEYTLKSEKGKTTLVVQSKDGKSAAPEVTVETQTTLLKGSGKVTLRRSFVVPETSELHVYVPLYAGASATKTGILDARLYNIAPKK
ncbi:MAG: hypothetical protein COT18_00920 [Elusimicrobia bacterium CG08_land_8_20_14_0_20_59_10]|nr:MAG: hypothetical protein COT18_00920 [Elusimicrobia bacterium CG08_land_8_20_14_0_20_59_10]